VLPSARCPARASAVFGECTEASRFTHHGQSCPLLEMCWGSNTHTVPRLPRGVRVASCTSALFEVTTTGPGADMIAGIARDVDFPVRGPAIATPTPSQSIRTGRCPSTVRPNSTPCSSPEDICTPGRSRCAVAFTSRPVIPRN